MNELKIIEKNGKPCFVAADVRRALDISDTCTWNALQCLDDDEKIPVRMVLRDGKSRFVTMDVRQVLDLEDTVG